MSIFVLVGGRTENTITELRSDESWRILISVKNSFFRCADSSRLPNRPLPGKNVQLSIKYAFLQRNKDKGTKTGEG